METLEERIGKIEGVLNELNEAFRAFISSVEDRFKAVEGRLNHVEDRLSHVEDRLDHVEGRLGRVESELSRINDRIDRANDRIDRVEEGLRSNLKWIVGTMFGILMPMWISIILTIVLKM